MVSVSQPSTILQWCKKKQPLVMDVELESYDEEELLSQVALARATDAWPIVAFDRDPGLRHTDELLLDLSAGLIARGADDVERIAAVLSRRLSGTRTPRFVRLCMAPRGGALLAILSDGTATLIERPATPQDDGTEVVSTELAPGGNRVTVGLVSSTRFDLTVDVVTQKRLLRSAKGGFNGTVDGAKLGQRIRELRLAAGLTQAELARRTGIHRPNIARVEAGRHTPSLETLARLASAIGVPTTLVLDGSA